MGTTPNTPAAAAAAKTNPVDIKVKRIKVAPDVDASIQRHLDSTSDSVDGTLAWINATFIGAPAPAKVVTPGAPTPVTVAAAGSKPLVTKQGITAGGGVAAAGPVSGVAGTFTGPITGPSVAASGPVSGTTCSFPQSSFRYAIGPFGYANSSYGGGIQPACFSYGSVTMGSTLMGFPVPFAGSIVYMGGRQEISVATNFQPYFYKNNGSAQILSNGPVAAGAYTTWGQTYAKGTMPVALGDYLGLGVGWSATGSTQFTGWIILEAAP